MNFKKTLVAAAVAAVVAAPAASYADATLYGTLKMSMQSIGKKTSDTKSELNFRDGPWSGTRMGVKGTDDMGNGMSSFYNLELGVAGIGSNTTGSYGPDPTRSYNTRKALVGVKGDFGTAVAGRMGDLFYSYVESVVDPTYQLVSGLGPLGNGYTYRVTGLAYLTPDLNGFSGGIAIGDIGTDNTYTPASTANSTYNKQQQVYELGGKYTFGPGFVSAGYIGIPKNNAQLGTDSGLKSIYGLGAGYSFGMFGVAANVMRTEPQNSANKLLKITSYAVQGSVGVGAIDGYLMYSGAKADESGSHTATRVAAGVAYAVSKPMSVAFEVGFNNKYANAVGGSATGYQAGSNPGVAGYLTDAAYNSIPGDTYKASSVVSLSLAYSF